MLNLWVHHFGASIWALALLPFGMSFTCAFCSILFIIITHCGLPALQQQPPPIVCFLCCTTSSAPQAYSRAFWNSEGNWLFICFNLVTEYCLLNITLFAMNISFKWFCEQWWRLNSLVGSWLNLQESMGCINWRCTAFIWAQAYCSCLCFFGGNLIMILIMSYLLSCCWYTHFTDVRVFMS